MNVARAALAALVLVLAACGGPTFVVQQYDGPPRAEESIAIIRVEGDSDVQLVTLDGSPADARVGSDVRLHIEVLPGEHRLLVADAKQSEAPARAVRFFAHPGRVYRVVLAAQTHGWRTPRVYEVARDSDTLLQDVTAAADSP